MLGKLRWYCLRTKLLLVGTVIVLVVMVSLFLYMLVVSEETSPVIVAQYHQKHNLSTLWPKAKEILFLGIPGLTGQPKQQSVVKVRSEITFQNVMQGAVLFFTGVDIKDVRSPLNVEIPLLTGLKSKVPTVSAMSLPNFPKFGTKSALTVGKPLVGIYHTHTSESFVPDSKVTHKRGGQKGDIVDVGEALVKHLEGQGIGSVQSKAVHDYPSFMKAYSPSETTLKKMLKENPSIQMVFDIHRDANDRESSVAMVNGVQVARISILVATGQQGLEQPNWQENHAFAKLIDAKLNQHFPGLSKGIQLVEWRYNQHLHPRALLLEVGCQDNTKEEAIRTIELFGDVLTEIIEESKN